ncbi:hypothetical protein BSIN_3863 [Burkholderia singularis]|uniref:Uncharacterized protein n=1 Tax=Burkholderia singularis TaxID=1503053 RepID=A0A238H741_9BURK|nr:hypothetical protein BSIN_3863 [Burkholderia singularis]
MQHEVDRAREAELRELVGGLERFRCGFGGRFRGGRGGRGGRVSGGGGSGDANGGAGDAVVGDASSGDG